MERLYANEVISTIDGIVNIGGELTKCFMQQELDKFLTDVGYVVESIKKIEYGWKEEINNPPQWMKDPYPWDWLIRVRKLV
jgi:hypothetical protein